MKGLILIVCFVLTAFARVEGQVNYVLNPSFEEHSRCPQQYDEIKFANDWSAIDSLNQPPSDSFGMNYCTPEYCNVCGDQNFGYTSVPNNNAFHHYPRTGNGLALVQMYFDEHYSTPYKRDYLQGRLYTHLTAGKSYCVTFYVTIAQVMSEYFINHIGMYLDDGSIDATVDSNTCGEPHNLYIPQVYSNNIITGTYADSIGFTKIEGNFTASGTERFITIGNFFDKAHTSTSNTGWSNDGATWYLVDDVSVIESDLPAFAGHDTTITIGDSVFLGRTDLMPDVKWYVLGSSTVIDSNAGMWVKPDTTTSYVVAQTLCGLTTYDTVTVFAYPVGVNNVTYDKGFIVYPNPSNGDFTVKNLTGEKDMRLVISDMSGKRVYEQAITVTNNKVHANLPAGMYMVQMGNGRLRYWGKMVVE